MKINSILKVSLLASSLVLSVPSMSGEEWPCPQSACEVSWNSISESQREEVFKMAKDYKAFMNVVKNEISGIKEAIIRAEKAGFKEFKEGVKLKKGGKYYHNNRDRTAAFFIVGERDIREGLRVSAAHIDSPRIELKARPLYEKEGFAQFQTNFHGGIKAYQWESLPLALVGHIDKKDGTRVHISVGLDEGDPVFVIPGLSPHVDGKLRDRKNRDVLAKEEMDPVVGSIPDEDGSVKGAVVSFLKHEYGVGIQDFVSAELMMVPALKARDVGFDRGLTAVYGQDDKLASYSSLQAILNYAGTPQKTIVAHIVDNEESGSNNNTGASSNDFVDLVERLIYTQEGKNYRSPMTAGALRNTQVISIDVNAGINPIWPSAWEKGNAPRVGYGVNLKMYGRGFTANSEYTAWIRKVLDDAEVPWQTATYKVNGGGGGTVGKFYAERNMEVIDFGVALFSLHTTYSVSSKVDVWNLYRAVGAFYKAD